MGPEASLCRWVPLLLAAAAFCAGCGGSSPPITFAAAATARWTEQPATPSDVGYTITVAAMVLPPKQDAPCEKPPSSTHVFINGHEAKLDIETDGECMGGGVVLGPLVHDQTVTVTLEDSGEVTATATFKNLLPGTAATMSGPSELHEGDDIVIRPVPEIPDAGLGISRFYVLDAAPWVPDGTRAKTIQERKSDGLHLQAPAFTGPAMLAVWNTDCDYHAAEVSCPGFGFCFGENACALGPFFVTGAP